MEAALYCVMEMPGVRTLYPRPPKEARGELDALVKSTPDAAQLYALRAHVDEQALDFDAAERDWREFATRAQDKGAAEMELADFYHRRVEGAQEVAALEAAASVTSTGAEKFIAADRQQAWHLFPRALEVAKEQALGDDAAIAIEHAWMMRYPEEPGVRAKLIESLMQMRRYDEAQKEIAEYQAKFPQDDVFPLKAAGALALNRSDANATANALALFDKAYQPLWPQELVQSYLQLLNATHTQHAMLAAARAGLTKNPDDLGAVTRIFYYYQREGRMDAATNALDEYRASKESRHAAWSADELYTLATLLERAGQYEQAARYDYALAEAPGKLSAASQSPAETGLSSMVRLLLNAPESSIDLGSGNLSMYRDLATMDNGPGYLNGVLSLWLNSASPASEFSAEETKATPYFHRAKAAELLGALDQRFPAATERASLHADLVRAYLRYGEDAAVQQEGTQFLAAFPKAEDRLEIALDVADADARREDTKAEFALYDSLLTELGAKLQGMPLSAASEGPAPAPVVARVTSGDVDGSSVSAEDGEDAVPVGKKKTAATDVLQGTFTLPVNTPATIADAAAYQQALERYLGRLTATQQLPAALGVLRRELDRNPNDPMLYERLASFLQQNDLGAEQEEVFKKALARFNDTSFYDKLARFYLRAQRRQDYDALSRKVVDIFEGTELDAYFQQASGPWPEETLQLNLYAHKRFPHDLTFTRNLLHAYRTKPTADAIAWERLMREHWLDSPELQAEFFDYLGSTNKLDAELKSLQTLVPVEGQRAKNPAATRELAEIDLWQSHFEQSAPLLGELAAAYPADASVGEPAASVFRSLAYYDPSQVDHAVAIEKNLWESAPSDLDRLASIGDIYADSTSTALNLDTDKQLAQAGPYWKRMSAVHPGVADGYLQSATVFWDYFEFDDALAQIAAARKQFGDAALYGYQAGAIYENKREYAKAVAEYVAAATDEHGASSSASGRLLELANREEFAALIDKATEREVETRPTLVALELRDSVLSARKLPSVLNPLVLSAIAKATSVDELSEFAEFSQKHKLGAAYVAATQREWSMSSDPVRRIELQYELERAYVDQGNVTEAQKVVESVYKDNPRVVGVVRTTVDFYWSHKQPQRAIAVLAQAAKDANSKLGLDFTLEAVAKSNQSGDYAGARALLKPLLVADPYDGRYVSLQADSFAMAHDSSGLRDFYAATLGSLNTAPLNKLDKRDKIAMARQGMIGALTELKDYAGAVDQHIALVSAFPEDDNILQAAAAYARLHGRETQLVGFLNKTVAESPQDSRFAIDLARVDISFEDYDGALAAYSKAIAIRKDRADLYIARADIEEHQQSYDAACADYARLYLLTYKDADWMEKAALARARQGRPELAVKALQTARIDGRPAEATNYFWVADKLEEWDMLAQAEPFVAKGVELAGNELAQDGYGLEIYVRLMGRERKAPEVMDALMKLLANVGSSPWAPAIVMQQVQAKGLASIADEDWRKQRVARRQLEARGNFRRALQELSSIAAAYYTPEEKLAYAKLLDARGAGRPAQEMAEVWIPAAHTAGLLDREAAWRRDVLLNGGLSAQGQLQPFEALEEERMDNRTLAETLDAYAAQRSGPAQVQPLTMAAVAWRDAGDRAAETRDLRRLLDHGVTQYRERLFALLLQSDAASLLQMAAGKGEDADAAAEYVLEHGTDGQAYAAIDARAAVRPAVWGSATTAVAGLYFGDTSPRVDTAFRSALNEASIAERLQAKPDKTKQLVGEPWFYYAMRYGVMLTMQKNAGRDADELLPAELEREPGQSASYYELAQAYRDAHRNEAAIAEYRHVEELEPKDATPNADVAEVLWSMGRTDAAVAEWTRALTKLRATVDVKAVPESFWTNFSQIAKDASDHQLGMKLKPAMNTVLEAYIRKNKDYRSLELLRAAFTALEKQSASEAVEWVLSLITEAPDEESQLSLLSSLTDSQWFPEPDLDGVHRRELSLAQSLANARAAAQRENGITDSGSGYSASQVTSVRLQYLRWMLKTGKIDEAQRLFDGIPATEKNDAEAQRVGLVLAARQSRLAAVVAAYRNDPTNALSLGLLIAVANDLRGVKDYANSRLLLEYVFEQKLQHQKLVATDYVAVAELRLETNDLAGALDLLHCLTLQGDLYENLDTAASLLERTEHVAEALPLLTKLAHGVPWNQEYRLRLGRAQLALKQDGDAAASLSTVAADSNAGYSDRTKAAESLRGLPGPHTFDSAELTLVAAGSASAAADKPYFAYARLVAAKALPVPRRVSMLHAAMSNAPALLVDRLRLEIFRTEMADGNYAQAQVAVAPLVMKASSLFAANDQIVGADGQYVQNGYADDSFDASNSSYYDGSNAMTATAEPKVDEDSVLGLLNSPERQHEFLLLLATMHERLKDTNGAMRDLRAARRLSGDAAETARLDARLAALQAAQEVAAENATRRPQILPGVEQKVLVRPHLVAEIAKVRP